LRFSVPNYITIGGLLQVANVRWLPLSALSALSADRQATGRRQAGDRQATGRLLEAGRFNH